jgi:hypothetical protein
MALPPLNLAPLTELDSVNNLLLSIGQSPVNSLVVPGVKDVSIAQMTLHNTSREVQQKGWWFNTDTDYPLMPDINGFVMIPSNALEVVPNPGSADLTVRAGKLYNRTDRTSVFPQGVAVKCELNWFLAYADLPQVARQYIERRAGRIFQTNIVASQILYQFTKELEQEASAEMERNNLRVQRTNWFQTGASTNNIFNRR